MLWYKAWRESRTRFTIAAALLASFCLFVTLFHSWIRAGGNVVPPGLRALTYHEHVYQLVYSGTAKGVYAVLSIFIGLGGLVRERVHRTANFTLALPVSRVRLVVAQISVGLAELAALSLLTALLIPSLSRLLHQSFPLTEALHYSALWFTGGTLIFAAAFLLSVILDGEYVAPVACYIALMLHTLVASLPPLRPYRLNLLWIMGEFGTTHFDSQHNLLASGPLPWVRLLTIMLVALGLFALSARITRQQDF